MTLHPIPLNFLIYEENFIYFFISVPFFLLFILCWIGMKNKPEAVRDKSTMDPLCL
jgi:hypothetical protein